MKTQTSLLLQIPATRFSGIVMARILVIAGPVLEATRPWTGGAVRNGNRLTPGNWTSVAPAPNDLLPLAGSTPTATPNNFPARTPFNNLSFTSGASAFTINGHSMTPSEP